MSIPPEEELEPNGEEPEPGDVREDITRELARLFPQDRMQRIMDRFKVESDEDAQFVVDLISGTFTRGIEFGAIEVTAQQIQAGQQLEPQIDIAHVDLPCAAAPAPAGEACSPADPPRRVTTFAPARATMRS
jgi:hypothetical protein